MEKYCIAIANERGGHLILGVSDRIPRTVVGTNAFQNIESLKRDLLDDIHIRVEIDEYTHENKRVVIFEIPSRPVGVPLHYKGTYLMRVDDSLVPMTPDHLQKIFNEAHPDFSAEICSEASISDLSETAIDIFKMLWARKSNNPQIYQLSKEQLLNDSELLIDGKLNYAALILLGTKEALGKYLPNSE